MAAGTPIEVTIDDIVMNDPVTLQLRMRAEQAGTANTVSTVWLKDEDSGLRLNEEGTSTVSLDSVMQEHGDDPALAAAAERGSLAAIRTEGEFMSLDVDGSPAYEYEAPDASVVYVDTDGQRHEL